jgi:UPF0755 protein
VNDVEELEYAPPPPREPERHRRGRGIVRLLAFFVVLIAIVGFGALYFVSQTQGEATGRPVRVTIAQGATASSIATQLADAKVIRSPWLFKLLARMRGTASELKPGEYEMRTNMSYSAVFALLEKGPDIAFVRVTIPEGRTVGQVAQIVKDKLGIPVAQFMAAVRSKANRPSVVPASGRDLEGVLFPDTYFFKENVTADDVVQRLVAEFITKTSGLNFDALRSRGIDPYEAMVVASLIEREALVDVDRSKIASVIYNRLRRGMQLQIDATVQYAIYLKTGVVPTRVDTGDLKIDSPYNTYKIAALPPGPIASSGLASIRAALAPASTPYLYYVLSKDKKTHCFASTLDEFNAYKNGTRSCV